MIDTCIDNFCIKAAEETDCAVILKYIRALADFESELDQVTATEDILRRALFERKEAEVILGVYKGVTVGFAVYHRNFSTYLGQSGLHLIDLFIEPDMRGNGFGKAMLSYLADVAVTSGYGRFEWWVHDWNEPAISRYKEWGAHLVDYIRVCRLCADNLHDFSGYYKNRRA